MRRRAGHFVFHPGGQLTEFFIARRDGFRQLAVSLLGLPEHEEVFLAIVAAPVEGEANKALRDFLAKSLGLSRSKVLLEKGGSSRFKTFEIPDGTRVP